MLLPTYSAVVCGTIGDTKLKVKLRGPLLHRAWCSPGNGILGARPWQRRAVYALYYRYVRSPLGYFRRWIQGTLRVRTTLSITFRLGHVCLSCVKGMWATPFWSRFDLYASKKPCRLLQGPPFGLHSGPLPNISRTPILSSVCMPRCGCLPGSI